MGPSYSFQLLLQPPSRRVRQAGEVAEVVHRPPSVREFPLVGARLDVLQEDVHRPVEVAHQQGTISRGDAHRLLPRAVGAQFVDDGGTDHGRHGWYGIARNSVIVRYFVILNGVYGVKDL